MPTFARRLHGSSDIFEGSGRKPRASINYVTSHDGYTLHDLVSYKQRHNEDNGELNNDGHLDNLSENFGVEGATDDVEILALRRRQQRNFLVTLMISQGVPMLQAGDERNRTQSGNNNAYCQDNAISWVDWTDTDDTNITLTKLVTRLLSLRHEFPVLCSQNYIHLPPGSGSNSILWLNSDGQEMRDEHWQDHHNFVLGYMLSRDGSVDIHQKHLLIIFNNSSKDQNFKLPDCAAVQQWAWLIDTTVESGLPERTNANHDETLIITQRSVVVLCSDC